VRTIGWLLVLLAAGVAAAFIDQWIDPPRKIAAGGQQIKAADGDSFSIGSLKLRLDGIDAPEYRQSCTDRSAALWDCGKVARTSLEQMLRQAGLSCLTDAVDQYGRLIAVCSTLAIPDIGAAQVGAGMAISQEYFGVRSYADEEDRAKKSQRGIWGGTFVGPSEWREKAGGRDL